MYKKSIRLVLSAIIMLASLVVPAVASNALVNGGFETGTLENWTPFAFGDTNSTVTIDTTGAREGTKCLKMVMPGGSPEQWAIYMYSGSLYSTGKTLRFSAWFKTQYGTGGTPKVLLRRNEYNSGGTAADPFLGINTSLPGYYPSWTPIGSTFTVGQYGVSGAQLWLFLSVDVSNVSTTSTVHWDDAQLDEVVPLSDSSNNLPNGGFESDLSYWTVYPTNPQVVIDTATYKEGAKSVKMVVAGGTNQQVINMYTGGRYVVGQALRVSAWVKAQYGTGGTPSASLRRHEYTDANHCSVWDAVDYTISGNITSWTKMTKGFTVTGGVPNTGTPLVDGQALWVRLYTDTTGVSGNSSIWCDDVQVNLADPNQLVNAGFELGSLSGWTQYPYTSTVETTATAHEGSVVAKAPFNGASNGILQDISMPAYNLVAGHTYVVTAWYKYHTNVSTDYPYSTLNYYDGNGALGGPFLITQGVPGENTTWKTIKTWFNARDFPTLRLGLWGGPTSAVGTATFDDVKIEEAVIPVQPMDVYLLLGQSNMVGYDANFNDDDRTPNLRVLAFTPEGDWLPAVTPLRGVGGGDSLGVGPGVSFGKAMADNYPNVKIGLIPLAVGSTPISVWVKGGARYNAAIAQVQQALASGTSITLKGILWQQGESDSYSSDLAQAYSAQLQGMVSDLRADLGISNLPFVCGKMGTFFGAPYATTVNNALVALPSQKTRTATVSSDGLTDRGDSIHFNAASARTLGQRYATSMIQLAP